MNLTHYEMLADLFRYPEADLVARAQQVQASLKTTYPAAAADLESFTRLLGEMDLDQQQMLFTRTFDIQAVTTLDIAYVLFGDDYKRGEILSNLNREHQKAGTDCGCELADHLPNLLCLLARLKDVEVLNDLILMILAPAVRRMLGEFQPDSINQKKVLYKKHYKTLIEVPGKSYQVYEHALKALFSILKSDFDIREEMAGKASSHDFLRSVSQEMKIEKVANQ